MFSRDQRPECLLQSTPMPSQSRQSRPEFLLHRLPDQLLQPNLKLPDLLQSLSDPLLQLQSDQLLQLQSDQLLQLQSDPLLQPLREFQLHNQLLFPRESFQPNNLRSSSLSPDQSRPSPDQQSSPPLSYSLDSSQSHNLASRDPGHSPPSVVEYLNRDLLLSWEFLLSCSSDLLELLSLLSLTAGSDLPRLSLSRDQLKLQHSLYSIHYKHLEGLKILAFLSASSI